MLPHVRWTHSFVTLSVLFLGRKKYQSSLFFVLLLLLSVKVSPPSDLRVTNFSGSVITVRWEAAADDVVSYLIKWISLSGGDLRQVRKIREEKREIMVSSH